jgi:hypothetical protein
MVLSGNNAFCAGGENGLLVYNVGNLASPAYEGQYGATAGYYEGATVSATDAFCATQNNGMKVFDVTNPAVPGLVSEFISSYNAGGGGQKVVLAGNQAFFLTDGQINEVNISNLNQPVFSGSNSSTTFYAMDFCLDGNYIVAVGFDTAANANAASIATFDISNPGSLVLKQHLDFASGG